MDQHASSLIQQLSLLTFDEEPSTADVIAILTQIKDVVQREGPAFFAETDLNSLMLKSYRLPCHTEEVRNLFLELLAVTWKNDKRFPLLTRLNGLIPELIAKLQNFNAVGFAPSLTLVSALASNEACSAELARLGAIERLLELALLPLTSPAAFDTLRKFTPTRLLRSIPIEQFAFILKTTDFLLEIRNRFAELFYELCSKNEVNFSIEQAQSLMEFSQNPEVPQPLSILVIRIVHNAILRSDPPFSGPMRRPELEFLATPSSSEQDVETASSTWSPCAFFHEFDDSALTSQQEECQTMPSIRSSWVCEAPPGTLAIRNEAAPMEPMVRSEPTDIGKVLTEDIGRRFEADPDHLGPTLVFDRESLTAESEFAAEGSTDILEFESRFESGNLRRAYKVRQSEYDLYITSDTGAAPQNHLQWFYFKFRNAYPNTSYRFNIKNEIKTGSQFEQGMQPVFLVDTARDGWRRGGSNVYWYRNELIRSSGKKPKRYMTLTFTFSTTELGCTDSRSWVWVAYHYPYSYTDLKADLRLFESTSIHFKVQTLCSTPCGNAVHLVTITDGEVPTSEKDYVFFSARVHPGETNSSWVMRGLLQFLSSEDPEAQALRRRFVFKVVPMLNPDGVILGNHRCDPFGNDLNRAWLEPTMKFHPTIYTLKALMEHSTLIGKPPQLFVDIHGHSRRRNIFFFGCMGKDEQQSRQLNFVNRVTSCFGEWYDRKQCNFSVTASKKTTARVVGWRQLGIERSFTVECTYSGMDIGPAKGFQIDSRGLMTMGANLARSVGLLDQDMLADEQLQAVEVAEDSDVSDDS